MKTKLGASFSEHIFTEKPSLIKSVKTKFGSREDIQIRTLWLLVLIFIAAAVLLGRLFYLQILHGSDYRLLSDINRTKTEIIHAPRGIIFDRNGNPLVFNTPGFREIVQGKTEFFDQKSAISLLANNDSRLEIDSLRMYPYKDAFAHVLGYLGQISPDQLADPDFNIYKVGDVIGQMGLEQEYEKYLKGINGEKLEEVDATGKFVRTLGQTDPIAGQNITTTLDVNMQLAAYHAMETVRKGAVIVSRPNGEILALLSKPSFDPNLFTMGKNYQVASESAYRYVDSILQDNDGQPLLNRAIGGVYPPGSTFKLVTAAAGLDSGKIDENYTVDDTGILKIGDFSFANWYYTGYGRTEGLVNVVKAIKRSNDIFFYKLGNLLGVDTISAKAKELGVGSPLGIDLLGERSGLLPTREWKQKTLHEDWYTGDDYHYAIGQGYLLTTPLQVNTWTQAIANGGTVYVPHLLKTQSVKIKTQQAIGKDTIGLIREGMIEACDSGGVAWPLFNFAVNNPQLSIDGKNITQAASQSANFRHVVVACKTGTAQNGTDTTLPHAWITLFAPAYNPQIIVTVLVENSGEGSNIAGPIAKEILESYFSKQN